jgi:hypothetical protein
MVVPAVGAAEVRVGLAAGATAGSWIGLPVPVALPIAQIDPARGSPLAYLGTFLVGALFYALTAHVAARYVLGDVPYRRALVVGVVPAAVTVLLSAAPIPVILVAAFLADLVAFRQVYRVRTTLAALIAVVHYTVTIILILTIRALVELLATAPT